MATFDPELSADRRQLLASSLDAALSAGSSEGDGIEHYSIVFDQAADGLLVITVARKRRVR